MKFPKQRYEYFLLIYIPIIGGGMLLGWLLVKPLTYLIPPSCNILLIGIILLALSPFGKQRVPTFDSTLTPKYWLLSLIIMQLGMYFMSMPVLKLFPALQQSHLSFTYWPIYLLLAIALAYFAAQKKSTPLIDTSLRTLFPHKFAGILGVTIDMSIKHAFFVVCALTLSAGIIGLIDNRGTNFSNLLLGILLCLAINIRPWRQLSHYLWHQGKNLTFFLPLIVICLLFILVLFTLLTKLTAAWLPATQTFILQLLNYQFLTNNFALQLLNFAWWISWAPLIAWLIAPYIQGKTIRSVILCGLLLPIFFMLNEKLINLLLINPHVDWLFAILSLIITCALIKDANLMQLITVTSAQKNRGTRLPLSSIRSLLAIIITTLIICLLTGISFISLFLFASALPAFITILGVIWAFLKAYLNRQHPPTLEAK